MIRAPGNTLAEPKRIVPVVREVSTSSGRYVFPPSSVTVLRVTGR